MTTSAGLRVPTTWVRKGVPLVNEARAALARNEFPLFVAERSSTQKKAKIRHNA